MTGVLVVFLGVLAGGVGLFTMVYAEDFERDGVETIGTVSEAAREVCDPACRWVATVFYETESGEHPYVKRDAAVPAEAQRGDTTRIWYLSTDPWTSATRNPSRGAFPWLGILMLVGGIGAIVAGAVMVVRGYRVRPWGWHL